MTPLKTTPPVTPHPTTKIQTTPEKTLFLGLTGSVATRVFPLVMIEAGRRGYSHIILYPTTGALPFVMETILRRYRDILSSVGMLDAGGGIEKNLGTYDSHKTLGVYLEKVGKRVKSLIDTSDLKVQELIMISDAYEDGEEIGGIHTQTRGGIKHIDIARKIDTALIAPATANTISKIVHGITDSFLLEVVRAIHHDGSVPVYIAPAMNTEMLYDPFIQANIETLRSKGSPKYHLLPTQVKQLQCGEYGDGGLMDIEKIFDAIN